jgi:hypothetical protein
MREHKWNSVATSNASRITRQTEEAKNQSKIVVVVVVVNRSDEWRR